MEFSDGAELLDPDFSKSKLEVYRDSVEAAVLNFQNTDVFTYITGDQDPSWITQWDSIHFDLVEAFHGNPSAQQRQALIRT